MPATFKTWMYKVSNRRIFRLALMVVAVGMLLVSLTPLADLSYDLSCQAKPDTVITNAVLVYFNQKTLRDLGSDHGNLNRTNHALLLNHLAQDGAKLVFYDVVFDLSNQVPEIDQTLARAIRKQGAVILVCGFEDSQEQGVALTKTPSLPAPLFRDTAKGWGHAELLGNVVREISGDYTSIPYAVWVAATNLEPQKLKDEDPNRDRWLNYYGGPDSAALAHCSLQDALANNIPPGFFAKKIVFVGQNFPSDNVGLRKDTFATPYSRFGARPMPGMTIHATALLNLLRDDWLRPVPWQWQWLGATLWAIICTSGCIRFRGSRRRS